MSPRRAVILLSGGLDSATAAAMAKADGLELFTLTLSYGQRHRRELESARAVSRALGAREHLELHVPLDRVAESALTRATAPLPLDRSIAEIGTGIPPTYVPARNTVFLSFALAWAESLGAESVWIGANVLDYSGYPDCRPEFFEAVERVAALGTKRGVEGKPIRVVAPLLRLSKAEIIRKGTEFGAPFAHTWSCYEGGERPCGRCDSCLLRAKGFQEAGIADPLLAGGR